MSFCSYGPLLKKFQTSLHSLFYIKLYVVKIRLTSVPVITVNFGLSSHWTSTSLLQTYIHLHCCNFFHKHCHHKCLMLKLLFTPVTHYSVSDFHSSGSLQQVCTNYGWQVMWVTKFCMVVPNIPGSSVQNFIQNFEVILTIFGKVVYPVLKKIQFFQLP